MPTSNETKTKTKLKDVLGSTFLSQKDKVTGKLAQVTVPTNFRVGLQNCDAALTVTGPIFSLCDDTTSIIKGNLTVEGNFILSGTTNISTGGGGGGGDTNASYVVMSTTASLSNERQ